MHKLATSIRRLARNIFAGLLIASFLQIPSQGQDSGSSAPPVMAKVGLSSPQPSQPAASAEPINSSVRADTPEKTPPPEHRTLFAAALATHWTSLAFDAATTHHGLAHCNEGNPLFGAHPSNGRVLVPLVAFSSFYTWLSIRERRKHPESKAPIIGNFMLGGGHIAAGILNTRCF